MKRPTRTLILFAAILALAVVYSLWRDQRKPSADGTATARLPKVVVAPAVVESASDVIALGFERSGRLREVLVSEGDRVEAGQVLARLDAAQAQTQLAEAEAALEAARARRDAVLEGARPEERAAAEAELRAAEVEARQLRQQADRLRTLWQAEALPQADWDRADSAAQAAAARRQSAQAQVERLRRGSRPQEKREAEAALAAAEAQAAAVRVALAQTELRAPRPGTIIRRLVEPGTMVVMMPPTAVLTLADMDQLRLRAEVDEVDIGQVKPGMQGFARATAFGEQTFSGRVVHITRELGRKRVPTDDPRARMDTRVLEILFAFDQPSPLPLGLRMELHLPTERSPSASDSPSAPDREQAPQL